MAPVSKKRTSLRARAAKPTAPHPHPAKTPTTSNPTPRPSTFTDFASDPDWKTTKRDKRAMKHSLLMTKVRDAGVRKPVLKRRRPGKKLGGTSLGGLADALPDINMDGEAEGGDEEWEGVSEDEEDAAGDVLKKRRRRRQGVAGGVGEDGKMVMRSLKHRPGAAKRKRVMEGREMERFGRNLAEMVGRGKGRGDEVRVGDEEGGGVGGEASQAERWAALRRFIGGSMQSDGAFAKA